MKVRNSYKILFLVLVVLTIYFPAISGEVNSIDDVHIINAYGINGNRALKDIFSPTGQFYFRPLIELTYLADNHFWGLDASFMHLENVVIHTVNVILVFCLAAKVSVMVGGLPALPFVSSLLFALHPVNTEAVSWIAGRTDPLAASFILTSVLLLLKGGESERTIHIVFSLAAMLASFFVKETSVMLLPVSLVVMASQRPAGEPAAEGQTAFRARLIWMYASIMVVFAACISLRLFWRISGNNNAFSMVMLKNYDLGELLSFSAKAMGFYLKKLLIPYPLNFAIHSVSDWYLSLGAIVLLLSAYIFCRRGLLTSFLLAGFLFIVPAIAAAAAGVNWTPVAERYLYIPTAFFSIGASGLLLQLTAQMKIERWVFPSLGFLVLPVACTTFERNFLWRDNLALYSDTVRKSPDFGDVHNEFGIALLQNGRSKEAADHFILAEKLSKRHVIKEFARMNLMNMALQGKSPYERGDIIRSFIKERDYVPPELLKMLRNTIQEILLTEKEKNRRVLLIKEMVGLNDRLYRETHDPLCLYNNGQLMLELGNRETALSFFRRAVASASNGAYYMSSARKLVERLEH